MGRGRQKAKHTKVARELKYSTPNTNLSALERELGVPSSEPDYEDKWCAPLRSRTTTSQKNDAADRVAAPSSDPRSAPSSEPAIGTDESVGGPPPLTPLAPCSKPSRSGTARRLTHPTCPPNEGTGAKNLEAPRMTAVGMFLRDERRKHPDAQVPGAPRSDRGLSPARSASPPEERLGRLHVAAVELDPAADGQHAGAGFAAMPPAGSRG